MSYFISYISVARFRKFFKIRLFVLVDIGSHDEALYVEVHLEEFILQ